MSYVLDGIETRMVSEVDDRYAVYRCPCGFVDRARDDADEWLSIMRHERLASALRFHYQFCPEARLPRGEVQKLRPLTTAENEATPSPMRRHPRREVSPPEDV